MIRNGRMVLSLVLRSHGGDDRCSSESGWRWWRADSAHGQHGKRAHGKPAGFYRHKKKNDRRRRKLSSGSEWRLHCMAFSEQHGGGAESSRAGAVICGGATSTSAHEQRDGVVGLIGGTYDAIVRAVRGKPGERKWGLPLKGSRGYGNQVKGSGAPTERIPGVRRTLYCDREEEYTVCFSRVIYSCDNLSTNCLRLVSA
ncbi:hypothetical protein Scep_023934 [Stephania cephalantha]|uniref:Uncharacterized protein n=1 Tax=Stephania cephalantha TaxID=152367 RepID=A0AAP0EW42_9MAGN